MNEDDPSFIAAAIGDIAKARGVSQFAKETGLSREAICKSFRPGGNPTIETVHKADKGGLTSKSESNSTRKSG